MEFHRGRMLDHVHLVVADLEASKRFYSAVLGELGIEIGGEGPGFFFADELFVSQAAGGATTRVHLALQADDRDAVARFHRTALAAGGRDNGAPGERHYHPGVHHGPSRRSTRSVVITPAG